MTYTIDTIDIEDDPALRQLINSLQRDQKPRALMMDGWIVAIVTPTPDFTRPDRSPEERRAAFLRSAGSWKGLVDTEALKKAIYESRGREYYPESDE